jgi:hypothetical protein
MATLKEAVQNTTAFAVETLGPERAAGLQFEEVASAKVGGQDAWLITLSMTDSKAAFPLAPKRDYKVFTVLKTTGEVTSMKIRELATT